MDSSSFTADNARISTRPSLARAVEPRMSQGKVLREAAIIFGVYTLIALLSTSYAALNHVYNNQPPGWTRSLVLNLLDWYMLAAFTPVFLWLVRRWPLGLRDWRVVLLYVVVLSALVLVKYLLYVPIRHVVYPIAGISVGHVFMKSFFYDLFEFSAVVGVVHAVEYGRSLREGALRASQLEARLSNARLEVLRSELQPHFLFNALHAISTLMHRNVEAADEMLTQLGDLLRLTLERKSVQEVPLREELSVLEPYLNIVRIRFGDRLSIGLDIDPTLLDFTVPLFMLQPLVENAIHHGIARRAGAGRIEIRARAVEDSVQITVFDDGAGLSNGAIREGIGLSNTRMRLEQLYGPKGKLALNGHSESGTEVIVTIPRGRRKSGGESVL